MDINLSPAAKRANALFKKEEKVREASLAWAEYSCARGGHTHKDRSVERAAIGQGSGYRNASLASGAYPPEADDTELLVSGDLAPHLFKMPPEMSQVDESQQAAAIAQWDDEGGASRSSPANAGDRIPKKHPTPRRRVRDQRKETLKCLSPG